MRPVIVERNPIGRLIVALHSFGPRVAYLTTSATASLRLWRGAEHGPGAPPGRGAKQGEILSAGRQAAPRQMRLGIVQNLHEGRQCRATIKTSVQRHQRHS